MSRSDEPGHGKSEARVPIRGTDKVTSFREVAFSKN